MTWAILLGGFGGVAASVVDDALDRGALVSALDGDASIFGVRANRRGRWALAVSDMGGSPFCGAASCRSHHPKPRTSVSSGRQLCASRLRFSDDTNASLAREVEWNVCQLTLCRATLASPSAANRAFWSTLAPLCRPTLVCLCQLKKLHLGFLVRSSSQTPAFVGQGIKPVGGKRKRHIPANAVSCWCSEFNLEAESDRKTVPRVPSDDLKPSPDKA